MITGTVDISVLPLEETLPAESSSEEGEQSSRGDIQRGEGIRAEQETINNRETGTPPDREGTETGSGSVITGTLDISALPLEETLPAEPSSAEEESGSAESNQALEGEGIANEEGQLPAEGSELPVEESTSKTETGQEGSGEGNEDWNPPDLYANIDSYGNFTVVDADGKPIDCPPYVTKIVGDKGEIIYLASYQAGGKTYSFEISSYVSSLENCYVNYGQDGKVIIVDADGNPLPSQPLFQKFLEKGEEIIYAYYQGAGNEDKVMLSNYSTSLENCYVNYGMDGKATVVDADGKPLPSQPLT